MGHTFYKSILPDVESVVLCDVDVEPLFFADVTHKPLPIEDKSDSDDEVLVFGVDPAPRLAIIDGAHPVSDSEESSSYIYCDSDSEGSAPVAPVGYITLIDGGTLRFDNCAATWGYTRVHVTSVYHI